MVELDEETMNEIPTSELSMEELLLAKEKSSLISLALKKLPDMERILLEGKYLLQYSDEELAEQLDCKPNSIRMGLTRARRHAFSILSETDWEGDDDDEQRTQSIAGTV